MTSKLFLLLTFISLQVQAMDNYLAGTRVSGLSNCGVSIPDLWSVAHNQAGLAFLEHTSVAFSHQRGYLLKELSLSSLAFALPLNRNSVGCNLSYFGYPKYHESKAGIAYALKLWPKFSLGLQLDYFSASVIDQVNSKQKISFEFGALSNPLENLFIGMHVFNPVPDKWQTDKSFELPFIARFGASYLLENKLMFAIESQMNAESSKEFRFGMEYNLLKSITLRAGIANGEENYSFGMSYSLKKFQTGMAFVNHQVLGFTPSIDIAYVW